MSAFSNYLSEHRDIYPDVKVFNIHIFDTVHKVSNSLIADIVFPISLRR